MSFVVVGSSEDIGSGLNFDRAGLKGVLKAAGNDEFDVLLVKKLDRLGRDTAKTMELLKGFDQLGIRLYSPLEGEITIPQLTELYDGYDVMNLE